MDEIVLTLNYLAGSKRMRNYSSYYKDNKLDDQTSETAART